MNCNLGKLFQWFGSIVLLILFVSSSTQVYSAKADTSSPELGNSRLFTNTHFQLTLVDQYHPRFNVKYKGANSLIDTSENCLSLTTTLFMGFSLWENGELYFNPEVAGGTGFSKVQGIAGFPNNEVVRVGKSEPTFYIARFFLQHTFNLSDSRENLDDDINQIRSSVSPERLIIRFGKFGILDYFDANKFSHDGRSQFMNWSLVSNGAWDYSADTRGYTIILMGDYITPEFSLRVAAAMVSNSPNGPVTPFKSDFTRQNKTLKNNSLNLEFEKSYSLFGEKGRARLLLFKNATKSALYSDVIEKLAYSTDSTSKLRKYGSVKYGFGLNLEQDINENAGVFLRAGWNDGKTETFMFTEIDRNLSFGFLMNGTVWHRKADQFGLAFSLNGLSSEHKNFLKNGGYGFVIGDGKLNYGIESIFETFYLFRVNDFFYLTLGYQFILNPAYNKDRGPVHVLSLRTHFEM